MKRKVPVTGFLMSVYFIGLIFLYRDFVLDDAFIIYRYADNLSHFGRIVWNVGEDPVEGFTSFLWVILNAGAIALDINPVVFSKTLTIISALIIIWILMVVGRNADWTLNVIFVGAVALSPPFAFLAMQGLETIFTSSLLLMSALLSLRVVSKPKISNICAWFGFAFVGFLSRPDTAVFNLGVLVALLIVMIRQREFKALRAFLLFGTFFGILLSLYMIWRFNYFGYLFPNTFYIKLPTKDGLIKPQGVEYAISFVTTILFPYLVFIALLGRKHLVREKLLKIFPILLGCFLFVCYILTILPIQGFLWRFIFPIYPAFLLGTLFYFKNMPVSELPFKSMSSRLLLIVFFVIWTLKELPTTFHVQERSTQFDRVAVGKALAGLQGSLGTSESGALPYYSGWKAVDFRGLNSAEIAHNGLSYKLLDSINPDLVMASPGVFLIMMTMKGRFQVVNQYIMDNDFVAVAAIHKSNLHYHFYFVRADSELFNEIVFRLHSVKEVEYGNLFEVMLVLARNSMIRRSFLDTMFERQIPIYQQESKTIIRGKIYNFLDNLESGEVITEKANYVRKSVFTINDDKREILFEHPNSEVIFEDVPINENAQLKFGIGINERAWDKAGDGVLFEISIIDGNSQSILLFSKYIDPKNNVKDRKWFDEQINLNPFAGQKVSFIFKTTGGPKGDRAADWAGWSRPQVVSKIEVELSNYLANLEEAKYAH